MVYAIITHTDIDGVGAAALYLYLSGNPEYRVFFTEPFLLHRSLAKASSAYYERIVILDLGINPQVYNEVLKYVSLLRKHEIPISWYDHHVWEDRWVRDMEALGVELHIDRSTCATGVVAKYVAPRGNVKETGFVDELVKGICAGDLWKFDHWLGPYYIRLVRRKDSNSWRRQVLKVLASGKHWTPEFDQKVVEHVERELGTLTSKLDLVEKNVNGLKVIVAESHEDLENSFLAAYIMGRYSAEVAVLVAVDGKLSFRSRGVNVRDLALELGGGGHPYASGAKVKVPWVVRFLSRINRRFLLNYVAELTAKTLARVTTANTR